MNFQFQNFFADLLLGRFYFTLDEVIELRDYLSSITTLEYQRRHASKGYIDFKTKNGNYRLLFKDSGNFPSFYDIKEISSKQNNPWD